MIPPALSLEPEQRAEAVAEERVVFYLRADQLAALRDEATRQAVARQRLGAGKRGSRPNLGQVIKDALVAAGVIEP